MSMDFRKTYKVTITDEDGTGMEYAIRTELFEDGKWQRLRYYNFEREHLFWGKVKKQLKNGFVFKDKRGWIFTFTELTMEEFNTEIRPRLDERTSAMINDLDDVYTWCRHLAGIN